MQIEYGKQPKKYLKKADANTRTKLEKAIEGLKELEGDIKKLKGLTYTGSKLSITA